MRVLSYRGPAAPGGVSNSLSQVLDSLQPATEWWYVDDSQLKVQRAGRQVWESKIESRVCVNHYRYCNNFLWPVLHDMPQHAVYSDVERKAYRTLNCAVSVRLKTSAGFLNDCFVNDYQFALVPSGLDTSDSYVFWHIPWPKQIHSEHLNPMIEVVSGLLKAKLIGFHVHEYLQNFIDFVERYLPQYRVSTNRDGASVLRKNFVSSHATSLFVSPLGLDAARWNSLSLRSGPHVIAPPQRYILSVDRCDYTKGVAERIAAIDAFFSQFPKWRRKVFFLQIGTRSRQGLPEFDSYWRKCQQLSNALNNKWAQAGWQPLSWIEESQSIESLAAMYRDASVMLVNPLRDGLNLTAKEFVACQRPDQGILALSRGAGVWSELGGECIEIDSTNEQNFARTIDRCLEIDGNESRRRTEALKAKVRKNDLKNWWTDFQGACHKTTSVPVFEKVCSL